MITFSGKFYNGSYIYDKDMEALRQTILTELNTLRGDRPYLPDYGSSISSYSFSLINQSLINRVFNEIKRVVENGGMTIKGYSYELDQRQIKYRFTVMQGANKYDLDFTYNSGVVS